MSGLAQCDGSHLRRSAVRFNLLIGGCVIALAFLYGISAGLSRNIRAAHIQSPIFLDDNSPAYLARRVGVPSGVILTPMGKDIVINNKKAELLSFVSGRSLVDIHRETELKWRELGFTPHGLATDGRGVLVAYDKHRSKRYAMTLWSVPPNIRALVSSGKPVQGTIAIVDDTSSTIGGIDGASGEVPGVRIKPGGSGGAVISSLDQNGRSFTGVYTLPGSVFSNMDYYRNLMRDEGWTEIGTGPLLAEQTTGHLNFLRGREELTVLFTGKTAGSGSGKKETVATVILAPSGRQAQRS